ncbi:DNA/RNA nuclease SfsA [Pyrococcus furiosus DSM 3638]|uniref:Sugar fermentation stimulation protein homolog n=3 Tax=Pyrococcus furiosus TaxID=2261 RepID=SFSA_PYRFU|nr:DNA/RNA nuclease SfsA [Pyrococcus furiosus]Q8U1K8.1 RecName: Full=Sugar fermentation stimulation protein homolog [Pyrococcus furiosus DSM 3638]AAL81322.1 sugar fermentation stimulation protein [Pyrococcus furiosus DSM 3638]QEK78850.1 DNA/RNA nuclease SfsA [Pyrococcus furiosus DSM 3638]
MKLMEVSPLFPCIFLRRVNRFVGLVRIKERIERALITNTGRLNEFMIPGRIGYCTPKAGGKTRYILLGFEDHGKIAIIDTRLQGKAFEKIIEKELLPELEGCRIIKREPRVGESRLDYLLECSKGEIFVETKSAVLREGEYAMYPDCPSVRGQRHIKELIKLARDGKRAMIVFIGALPNVSKFKPYKKGDPKIAELLKEALEAGVEIRALGLHMELSGEIIYRGELGVEI